MALVALHSVLPMPALADEILRLAVMIFALLFFARPALDLSTTRPWSSVLIGVLVFAIWIAPDLLFPGYRRHFENAITGVAHSSLSLTAQGSAAVLVLRSLRAALIVPVVEELFWRAWLMRWIINPNFQKIPLGAYTAFSFWAVAVLFASEHGPYWDVGLVTGVIYNWWMVRTRSLGDLVLTHAVTNACLSAYVIAAGKWEYWL